MNPSIKSYSSEEIFSLLSELNEPRFRANQLIEWLYAQGATSFQEMTNLPLSLREKLEERFSLPKPKIVNRQVSTDQTRKYILEFEDKARVETVAIPSFGEPKFGKLTENEGKKSKDASRIKLKRLTACLSTQVGCSMGCVFCATGTEGFTRNLSPGEIVDQIHAIQKDFDARVSNLVIMGQGEAFLNYENTLAALRFANSPKGLMIGARHITISTCGILSGITRLAQEPEQFTLAVSLHSAQQTLRNTLLPQLTNSPLTKLKDCLYDYVANTGRRVSLEYLMIKNVNDDSRSLDALIHFCEGLLCHINLLPINPIVGSEFKPSTLSTMKHWEEKLKKTSIPVSIRNSRGSDISGACGQLKNALR